jgi:diadenosine tetraphosphate (Ap4A) HIT family hydrolase
MKFQLHPRLQQDCFEVGRLPLSRLLLMNDSRYPWCILVPAIENIREIFQLSQADQQQLQHESVMLSQAMHTLFNADKMNIAAIGNMVPQLHIHHIVRYQKDPAWPAPVWGKFDPLPYSEAALRQQADRIKQVMKDELVD